MIQPSDGSWERDEAIARVEAAADHRWLLYAEAAVVWCSRNYPSFSTDEVWKRLYDLDLRKPREPRAMGAVIRGCIADGVIEKTGYIESNMASCHRRPKSLYRKARHGQSPHRDSEPALA